MEETLYSLLKKGDSLLDEESIMVSCADCGAQIDREESVCPYCGHTVLQHMDAKPSKDRTFGVLRRDDGSLKVRFGDGKSGRRPSSEQEMSAHYHHGSGSKGKSERLVKKLDQLYSHVERIPDLSRQQGSTDLGDSLIGTVSIIGDILSLYQSGVAREAYLNSAERKRLSTSEVRVRPKLQEMVEFCDRVDPRTKKKMGLSDSEIRKIKNAAVKALQNIGAEKCAKCGAMNSPETAYCQRCGTEL